MKYAARNLKVQKSVLHLYFVDNNLTHPIITVATYGAAQIIVEQDIPKVPGESRGRILVEANRLSWVDGSIP
jgi:hypothetical protein